MRAGEVKREYGKRSPSPILMRECQSKAPPSVEKIAMVEFHIKPHLQQVAEREARERQLRLFRRNQVIGLVTVAAAVCAWWLVHTHPGWIFTPGWWRW